MAGTAYEEDGNENFPWWDVAIYAVIFVVCAFIIVSCVAAYKTGAKQEVWQKELSKTTEVFDVSVDE